MFERILVAVDGSEHGRKAAHVAGEIARCMIADLWVVAVYDPVPSYLGEPNLNEALAERFRRAETVIQEALEQIEAIPGDIHREMLEGPVAEAILDVVEARQIDLIIMGTRGLGRLAGLLLGSQSQKVVSVAPCPVMLVR